MSEIHGATGSYVVHALDPDELDEFEAHLAVCPTCSRETVEFCETAAQLSLLAAAPAPPPALRDSVLSRIAEVRPLPPVAKGYEVASVTADGPVSLVPPPSTTPSWDWSAPAEAVPDELALRRAQRRTRVLTLLVAAVTVAALALGGVVVSLVRGEQAPIVAAPQVDPSLLGAPDAKLYVKTLPDGAHVSFVVSKSQNRAVFVSNELPSPGPGNVYHLWTLKGENVVRPDNVLNGVSVRTQAFSGPIDDSTALAVNIEPAGSSPTAPTTEVLALAEI